MANNYQWRVKQDKKQKIITLSFHNEPVCAIKKIRKDTPINTIYVLSVIYHLLHYGPQHIFT